MYRALDFGICVHRPLLCNSARCFPFVSHLQHCFYSAKTTKPSFPVDHSFTSSYTSADGRTFRFATVVVNSMRGGESALRAWDHACSLVGANPPTMAVTFVSKPTESAIAAIRELSLQFPTDKSPSHSPAPSAAGSSVEATSIYSGGNGAFVPSVQEKASDGKFSWLTSHHQSSLLENSHKSNLCHSSHSQAVNTRKNCSCFSTANVHGAQTIWSTSKGAESFPLAREFSLSSEVSSGKLVPTLQKLERNFGNASAVNLRSCDRKSISSQAYTSKPLSIAPLIGCVIDDGPKLAVTAPLINPLMEGWENDLMWMDDTDGKGNGPNDVSAGGGGANERKSRAGRAGVGGYVGTCRKEPDVCTEKSAVACQGLERDETSEEDDGTFSDWEDLFKEYDLLELQDHDINDEAKKDDNGVFVPELDLHLRICEGENEQEKCKDFKENMARFWNSIARSGSSQSGSHERKEETGHCGRAFLESIFRVCQNHGSNVRITEDNVLPWHLKSSESGEDKEKTGYRAHASGKLAASGEKSLLYQVTSSPDVNLGCSLSPGEEAQQGSICKKDTEESYKFILCVGNMPGVKAVGFYSRTIALPWLPNLTNAVTVNNPHMLLFGAPGFVFPEFVQRLAHMFPNGCRAGAFLQPLYSVKKRRKGKEGHEDGVLFYGSKCTTIGAVGLSISSDEFGKVPVDAFAEFVRMSIGMPCSTTWHTYFDETVSKSLFLPRNTAIEWLESFQRAFRLDENSVLMKMNAKLGKKPKIASQSVALATPASPMDRERALKFQSQKDLSVSSECGTFASEQYFPKESTFHGQLKDVERSEGQLKDVERSERLCIVSVDKVLFPGFFIPLYIDRPCDRLMVRHCLEQGKPFGVSNLNINCFSDPVDCKDIVGTAANLNVNLFDRGCRSYIIAHGVQRFRVVDRRVHVQPGSFGLNMGQVEFFEDLECGSPGEKEEVMELARQAVVLCQQLFPSAIPGLERSINDPIIASFAVSHILPVSDQLKRRWLSMVDTKYRLKEQMTFLNRLYYQLKQSISQ